MMASPYDPAGPASVPFRSLPDGTVARLVAYLIPAALGLYYFYEAAVFGAGLGLDFALFAGLKGLAALGLSGFLIWRGDTIGQLGALDRLRTRPHEVVWAYEKVLTRIRNGSSSVERSVILGFVDGKRYGFSIDRPLVEIPEVRSYLATFSHATFGHSAELEARYLAAPSSLRGGSA